MKLITVNRWFIDEDRRRPAHVYRFEGEKIAFEVPQEVHDDPGADWWWEAQENMKALVEVVQYNLTGSLTSPNIRIRQIAEAIVKRKKDGTL